MSPVTQTGKKKDEALFCPNYFCFHFSSSLFIIHLHWKKQRTTGFSILIAVY